MFGRGWLSFSGVELSCFTLSNLARLFFTEVSPIKPENSPESCLFKEILYTKLWVRKIVNSNRTHTPGLCEGSISGTVVRQPYDSETEQSYSCYGSRQILTSLSDRVLCFMRLAHARFLSDTILTHSPMVTSKCVYVPSDSI